MDIKQEDKKETKEHLERLEIKERDRTEKAKNGPGRPNQKIENAMTNGGFSDSGNGDALLVATEAMVANG